MDNVVATGLQGRGCVVDVNQCYQCGKCSAGCVLAPYADLPPSQVVRLLQTGNAAHLQRVLSSKTIWLCVGCEQCVERCPKQVDMPRLMDALRQTALQRHIRPPRQVRTVDAFYKSFLFNISLTGRLSEVLLVAVYKLRTLRLWQDVKRVPAMMRRGKLPLLPERVKGWRMPSFKSQPSGNAGKE